jgi:hypothetical protein
MENVSRYARLIKRKVIELDHNTCCIFYDNDLKIVSTNSFHFFYLRVGNGAKVSRCRCYVKLFEILLEN